MSGFSAEQLTAMHPKTEDEAFRAGYDCAVNGADTVNCHFLNRNHANPGGHALIPHSEFHTDTIYQQAIANAHR